MDKEGNEQARSKMRSGEHGRQEAKEATTETRAGMLKGEAHTSRKRWGPPATGRETSWHVWGSVPKPHRQRSPDTQ